MRPGGVRPDEAPGPSAAGASSTTARSRRTHPGPYSSPYTATKHAVTGLTKALSLEGRTHGISVGQIDVGNARTPMAARMEAGVPQADGSVRPEPLMDVADVARAVRYMAELPPDANVLQMTVMANEHAVRGSRLTGPGRRPIGHSGGSDRSRHGGEVFAARGRACRSYW